MLAWEYTQAKSGEKLRKGGVGKKHIGLLAERDWLLDWWPIREPWSITTHSTEKTGDRNLSVVERTETAIPGSPSSMAFLFHSKLHRAPSLV